MNTLAATQNRNFIDTTLNSLRPVIDLAGRVALATIFALAAINKIQYYEANAQFMASGGLPGELLPLVIAFELIGAIFIAVGFQARITALAFAGFSVITALLYHSQLSDQIQFLLFFKNIAMAGGFLVLAANGAGSISIDARRR